MYSQGYLDRRLRSLTSRAPADPKKYRVGRACKGKNRWISVWWFFVAKWVDDLAGSGKKNLAVEGHKKNIAWQSRATLWDIAHLSLFLMFLHFSSYKLGVVLLLSDDLSGCRLKHKPRATPIQLRTKEGHMLDPQQECQHITNTLVTSTQTKNFTTNHHPTSLRCLSQQQNQKKKTRQFGRWWAPLVISPFNYRMFLSETTS